MILEPDWGSNGLYSGGGFSNWISKSGLRYSRECHVGKESDALHSNLFSQQLAGRERQSIRIAIHFSEQNLLSTINKWLSPTS